MVAFQKMRVHIGVMDKDFDRIEKRAAALRLTERELLNLAGVSVASYWRAKRGLVNMPARVRTIRKVEGKLDALEGKVAVCGLCERRADDPTVAACTHSDCALVEKRAA